MTQKLPRHPAVPLHKCGTNGIPTSCKTAAHKFPHRVTQQHIRSTCEASKLMSGASRMQQLMTAHCFAACTAHVSIARSVTFIVIIIIITTAHHLSKQSRLRVSAKADAPQLFQTAHKTTTMLPVRPHHQSSTVVKATYKLHAQSSCCLW